MYFVYIFGVMLISSFILCFFVLWRVEEPATEDPGAQQIEVAEQKLIEGKLCPLLYLIMFFNITYSCIG
jgi:Na+/melibiose symporter-like transporter